MNTYGCRISLALRLAAAAVAQRRSLLGYDNFLNDGIYESPSLCRAPMLIVILSKITCFCLSSKSWGRNVSRPPPVGRALRCGPSSGADRFGALDHPHSFVCRPRNSHCRCVSYVRTFRSSRTRPGPARPPGSAPSP